jgi:hypothetical protein
VHKYLVGLRELAAAEERPWAKLLVVTGQPDEQMQQAVAAIGESVGVKVEWLLYRLDLVLAPVAADRPSG